MSLGWSTDFADAVTAGMYSAAQAIETYADSHHGNWRDGMGYVVMTHQHAAALARGQVDPAERCIPSNTCIFCRSAALVADQPDRTGRLP